MNDPLLPPDARDPPPDRATRPGARMATGCNARRVLPGYAVFGVAWILLSDRILFAIAPDMASLSMLGMWKGLSFVLLSTVLLYLLMNRGGEASVAGAGAGAAYRAPPAPGWLWGAFAMAAATIVVVGLVGVGSSASELRRVEVDELHAYARTQIDSVAAWRAEHLGDAQALGNDSVFESTVRQWRATGGAAARDAMVAQLRALVLSSDYEDVAVLDGEGRPLASGSGRTVHVGPGTLAGVQQALATGRVADAGLQPEGAARALRLDVVAPLRGATPADSFALLLRADPARTLLPTLARRARGDDTRTLLFTHEGGEGGASRYRLVAGLRSADGDPVAQRIQAWLDASHGEPAAEMPADAGAPEGLGLTIAQAVPDTGWMLVTHAPADQLHQATGRRTAWIATLDVLVLAVAAVLLYLAWQRGQLHVAQREREQDAEKLRALNLLDAIADGSTDAIYAKDLGGRYLLVNQAMCRLLGRPRQDILGRRDEDLGDATEGRRLWRLQAPVLRQPTVVQSEGWVDTPVGRRYFLDVRGPLRDADGQVIGLFAIARDATGRQREEERMRQWAAAMSATRDGVMITDASNRIVAVNRAFTAITGWTEEDALGEMPTILRSGRHERDFYRGLWETLRADGHWQGEIWNRRRNGEVFPEWLTISVVRDTD